MVKQKRLQKAGASGLFTLAMIEGLERVNKGLKGLKLEDSYGNGPHAKAQKWLRMHTRKRQVRGLSKKVV